ncbi:epoxide hydrolase family protein [Amycolatopsis pithecellobii]|uniref:Alpha/beta fold hydrolase n=1 Tax=Amycolatopsis pithecellobii TaxID=664692 RepID=A0A6N7YP74_9PSEU|nr:epoxide hydrolase family protein [Amycolatopsis pithecellobii]MTD53812.1 alpha/beta fold hydrolase [Amycolatopsis pithecellobii]
MNQIRPFHLDIPERELDDLRARLNFTRWPSKETVDDNSQGPRLGTLRQLIDHWRESYDWRKVEKELNGFGQFQTEIDGIDVHFLHVISPEPDALPLLMTHGWPGSVLEFRKVIGPLTNPVAFGGDARDAFHVIAPSMPGFGFSSAPTTTGWSFGKTADAWITLMNRLGYSDWGIQGGDLGAGVSETIAAKNPTGLVGMHLNFSTIQPSPDEMAEATPEEQRILADAQEFWVNNSSYAQQQQSRPQTIGYSLADSPVGLAAWLYTIFQQGCDTPENALDTFTEDELLDYFMLYWLPNAGVTSARTYWELKNSGFSPAATIENPITVPTGYTQFPGEPVRQSRRWLERRFTDLVRYHQAPRGGHFAALEQPDLFVDDVRATFRSLRS